MKLLDLCTTLQQANSSIGNKITEELVESVMQSIQRDTFHLAILGEFKRGKSSLVNSLLGGHALLPTDILPQTTCIHILEYGEEEQFKVVWDHQPAETFPLSKANLERYGAQGDVDVERIKYIHIRLSDPLLKQGLTIIDTPGVNDISRSRAEVTEQILPYCDAALFLIDAVAPLTRSEADFLQNKVLTYHLDHLLFILSKSDRLDEDELEESLTGATSRIHQVIGRELQIIPYSSREVDRWRLEGREHPTHTRLLKEFQKLQVEAKQATENRQASRLLLAVQLLLEQADIQKNIQRLNEEKLQSYQQELRYRRAEVESRFMQLATSIDRVGRQTLEQMLDKSVQHLSEHMLDQLNYQFRLQEGNPEKFWNHIIPLQMERMIKLFSETKAPEIQAYLNRFVEHVAKEYYRSFQLRLVLPRPDQELQMPVWNADIQQGTSSSVQKMMGNVLPFSVGAIAGSILLPGIGTIVGGALASILTTVSRDKKQEQVKTDLMLQLPSLVQQVTDLYMKQLRQSVFGWFEKLNHSLECYHREQEKQLITLIESKLAGSEIDQPSLSLEQIEELHSILIDCTKQLNGGSYVRSTTPVL